MESGTVIVTGGSRGIGAAVALVAAERGFAVAVNYANGKTEAASVVRMIRERGGRAASIWADVSREEEIVRLFLEAERDLGPSGFLGAPLVSTAYCVQDRRFSAGRVSLENRVHPFPAGV